MRGYIYQAINLFLFLVVIPFVLFIFTKISFFYYLTPIFFILYSLAQLILYAFYKEIFIKGVHYTSRSAQWLCIVMVGFIIISIIMFLVPPHYFN